MNDIQFSCNINKSIVHKLSLLNSDRIECNPEDVSTIIDKGLYLLFDDHQAQDKPIDA